MPADLFQIYFSQQAEDVLREIDSETAALLREQLAEKAVELQKIALNCAHAAVPVRTHELQADIVAEESNGVWKVVVQGTPHVNSDQPINTVELAFLLDGDDEYRRNFTNPGSGEITVTGAGSGDPTQDWIKLAHEAFSEFTGY